MIDYRKWQFCSSFCFWYQKVQFSVGLRHVNKHAYYVLSILVQQAGQALQGTQRGRNGTALTFPEHSTNNPTSHCYYRKRTAVLTSSYKKSR